MIKKSIAEYNILKLKNGELKNERDALICEAALIIFVNGEKIANLLCSSDSLKELAVGFLQSKGIVNRKEDIKDIRVDKNRKEVYITKENVCSSLHNNTNCSRKIESCANIDIKKVLALGKKINDMSKLFMLTGGTHSCALCSWDKVILFKEDIGRRNAIYKVLGKALLEGINLENKIIFTTGRVSSDIVESIARMKIPILISRSAPTNKAVDIARKINLVLVGFVRGDRMNIYTKI